MAKAAKKGKRKQTAAQKRATKANFAKMQAARRAAGSKKRKRNPPGGGAMKVSKRAAKKMAKPFVDAKVAGYKAELEKEQAKVAAAKKDAAEAKKDAAEAKQKAKEAKKEARVAKGEKGSKKGSKSAAKKPASAKKPRRAAKAKGTGKRKGKRRALKNTNHGIVWQSKPAGKSFRKSISKENKARRKNPTLSWTQLAVGSAVGGLSLVGAYLVDAAIATRGVDGGDAFAGTAAAERIAARPGALRMGAQVGLAAVSTVGAVMLRKYRWPATILASMGLGFGTFAIYQGATKWALPMLLGYDAGGLGDRLLPGYKPEDQEALAKRLEPGTQGVRGQLGQGNRQRPFAGNRAGVAGAECNGDCPKEKQCPGCKRNIRVPEGHNAIRSVNPQGHQVVTMVPVGTGRPPAAQQPPARPAAPPPGAAAAPPAPAPAAAPATNEVTLSDDEIMRAKRQAWGMA